MFQSKNIDRLSQPGTNLKLRCEGSWIPKRNFVTTPLFFSVSSATGRKQAETIGTFLKPDNRGIQRHIFRFSLGKKHSLFLQHAH